ncbi:hypothetical protein AVEN_211524-1 [Araneus ventricosus]|uniref:Uncharacterized protein n=1 Tax=Araneus ventricosus TaxID=182803 RepID=A0A4Y2PDS2_ARAVE|nr:hypothetical protein AVEN_211524-1 [Araneus ventricosus]
MDMGRCTVFWSQNAVPAVLVCHYSNCASWMDMGRYTVFQTERRPMLFPDAITATVPVGWTWDGALCSGAERRPMPLFLMLAITATVPFGWTWDCAVFRSLNVCCFRK